MPVLQPWVFYAILSALFAALTTIFAKAGLKNVNSDLATAIRTAIVLLIVWAVVFLKNSQREVSHLSRNNWIFLILSAFATGISWLFYYKALQIGKAAEVSAIDKGSIVFTVVLALLFLKEPVTYKMIAGILLISVGMMLMIWK